MTDIISFNTAIGLAFVCAVPALIIWMVLSFRVWASGGRILRKNNYRLAVSYFLFALTLVTLDQIRLRFHVTIFGIGGRDATTWLVFAIRWNWTFAVWWGTIVLYGHYIPRFIHWNRRRTPSQQPEHDPYLDDEDDEVAAKVVAIKRQDEQIKGLGLILRNVADELDRIIARIERDEPVLLPDARRRDRKEIA